MGNDYVDIDKLGEAALKELEAYGEVLIKKMDEKKSASPIGSKNNPHKMTLPQPMALLACSGLLEMIEKRYLGVYEPGAVFIVYAKIVSLESQETSFTIDPDGDATIDMGTVSPSINSLLSAYITIESAYINPSSLTVTFICSDCIAPSFDLT